jgi:hypothetical protein
LEVFLDVTIIHTHQVFTIITTRTITIIITIMNKARGTLDEK